MKLKTTSIILILLMMLFEVSYAQDFWQPTNGPKGGNFRDITCNTITGNTYLITHWTRLKGNGLGSNIFVSPDNGLNWNEIDAGLNGQPVYGITHNPTNQNLMVSVMDANQPLAASIPNKIYFSNDNGSSWTLMNSNYFVGNLPPVVLQYSSTGDIVFAGQKTNGISYTTDNGTTWQTMNTGITNLNITDIEFGYQGKLYACTESVSGNSAKVFVKNGTVWTDISSGLPDVRINELYYDEVNATMYLGTANFLNSTGAFYKSVNGGPWVAFTDYPGGEVSEINTTSNGDPVVRVFSQGMFRYTNGNWISVNLNLNSQKTSSFTHDAIGNILLTTSAGIWKFDDVTNSWVYFTNGIKNSQGKSIAFSQNGAIIVGTDNGIYKSADGGITWNQSGLTGVSMMSTFLNPTDGKMYAGDTNNTASHVYTSSDNGTTWSQSDVGFISTRTTDFALNSQGKLFVGSGWSRPVHSSTNGVNWSGPFWSALGFTSSTVTIAIAIDASDTIFVGTESQGVLRSTNSGASYSWVALSGGDVTDIKIAPNQDVYVTHDAFSGNGNGGLYKSTNGGTTWSGNLMPSHGLTNCVFIANSSTIYVGTTQGVWLSNDSGATWNMLNTGLNPGNIVIHSLELGPDGYLYAGTAGAGIYRSVGIINTSLNNTQNTSKLKVAVYPNPVDEQLYFSEELTNISVYNTFGQLVLKRELTLESIPTVTLSEGIYFIVSDKLTTKFVVKH